MIFATIILTGLLYYFRTRRFKRKPRSSIPALSPPVSIALYFYTKSRSKRSLVFYAQLGELAMPRGIEPRSPERQSGIITAIRWHHLYKERKRSAFFKLVVPLPSPPVRITDGMTSLAPTSPSLSSSVPHLYVYIISEISIKIKLFLSKFLFS